MSPYNPDQKRAVALRYDEDNHAAPVIVASGLGHMAERIVETAVENSIPVYEDTSLSTVLSQLELGAEIPQELYQAVVDIYVYFLNYTPGGLGAAKKAKVEVRPHQATERESSAPAEAPAFPSASPASSETSTGSNPAGNAFPAGNRAPSPSGSMAPGESVPSDSASSTENQDSAGAAFIPFGQERE